jgi:hypothetical protein
MKQLPLRSTKKSKGAVCDDECVEKIRRVGYWLIVDHQ